MKFLLVNLFFHRRIFFLSPNLSNGVSPDGLESPSNSNTTSPASSFPTTLALNAQVLRWQWALGMTMMSLGDGMGVLDAVTLLGGVGGYSESMSESESQV